MIERRSLMVEPILHNLYTGPAVEWLERHYQVWSTYRFDRVELQTWTTDEGAFVLALRSGYMDALDRLGDALLGRDEVRDYGGARGALMDRAPQPPQPSIFKDGDGRLFVNLPPGWQGWYDDVRKGWELVKP